MLPSPTRMFLTKGVGVHRHSLAAFEFALRDADIEQQNLVEPSLCVVHSSAALRGCHPQSRERVAQSWGYHLLRLGPFRNQ